MDTIVHALGFASLTDLVTNVVLVTVTLVVFNMSGVRDKVSTFVSGLWQKFTK